MTLIRILTLWTLACGTLWAANESPDSSGRPTTAAIQSPPTPTVTPSVTKAKEDRLLPGVTMAQGISEATGVAISPLLGVSAMGVWKYFNTPAEQRHLLPWYCQPWAWGLGLGLLARNIRKDVFGTAAPAVMKKPLDFLELFEDKASALVASTAFLPLVAMAMAQADPSASQTAATLSAPAELGLATSMPGMLAMEIPWVKVAIYTPVLLFCFGVVWLTSHAINVLIALSPFGFVDAGLKLSKLALLSVVTGAAVIHPLLGLLVCLPIIVLAAFLSGWAFRFTVFGTMFGWDLLLRRRARERDLQGGVHCFSARRLKGVPVRTYGTLKVNPMGMQVFRHRTWLILPAREVVIEEPLDGVTIGMLHPTVTRTDLEGLARAEFLLAPRYRACVQELGVYLGIQQFSDSPLRRGLKAVWHWFAEMVQSGRVLVERGTAPARAPTLPS